MLKISFHNHKLNELARWLKLPLNQVVSLDLPAGWTCAKANICKTFVERKTAKINHVGRITCYAAKAECYAPNTRIMRWHNFDSLRECSNDTERMIELIGASIPEKVKVMRIHSSGDFFSPSYFYAWVGIAKAYPNISFYGYTKHLDYAIAPLPKNMFLEYSFGGKDDTRRIELKYHAPTCYIGEYKKQYNGYKIVCKAGNSHEDYLAILNRESFVIMEH